MTPLDALAAMPPGTLGAFLAGSLLLNLTPGQDVLFATACGVEGGPRAGALAGLGTGLGGFAHVLAASLGLGALAAAHPGALEAVTWLGAGYLAWLAVQAWRAPPPTPGAGARRGAVAIVGRAALTNLLNAKVILFLLAWLPQFTDTARGPVGAQILALGLVFLAGGTAITAAYGLAAGLLGRAVGHRLGWLNRLAAVMFAGLAARLVLR